MVNLFLYSLGKTYDKEWPSSLARRPIEVEALRRKWQMANLECEISDYLHEREKKIKMFVFKSYDLV